MAGPVPDVSDGSEIMNKNKNFEKNKLFKWLSEMVKSLGQDITVKDYATMRSFEFDRPLRSKVIAGLMPRTVSVVVCLRNGDYSNVDLQKRINRKGSLRGAPMLLVGDENDASYAFDIIKNIYEKPHIQKMRNRKREQ